jgi:hypothetical protein
MYSLTKKTQRSIMFLGTEANNKTGNHSIILGFCSIELGFRFRKNSIALYNNLLIYISHLHSKRPKKKTEIDKECIYEDKWVT